MTCNNDHLLSIVPLETIHDGNILFGLHNVVHFVLGRMSTPSTPGMQSQTKIQCVLEENILIRISRTSDTYISIPL